MGIIAFLSLRFAKKTKAHRLEETVLPLASGYGKTDEEETEGRLFEDGGGDDYDLIIERLVSLLESERIYLNPELRVTEVAEKMGLSESFLRNVIKVKTNDTLCPMLHKYRIREAKRLVSLNPDIPLKELMRRCGYNSPTTFNNAFVRATGKTPAAWCKEYKQRNLKNGGDEKAGAKRH